MIGIWKITISQQIALREYHLTGLTILTALTIKRISSQISFNRFNHFNRKAHIITNIILASFQCIWQANNSANNIISE